MLDEKNQVEEVTENIIASAEVKAKKFGSRQVLLIAFLFFIVAVVLGLITFSINPDWLGAQKKTTVVTPQRSDDLLTPESKVEDDQEEKEAEAVVKGSEQSFALVKSSFAKFQASSKLVTPLVPKASPRVEELDNLAAFIEEGAELSSTQLAALEESGFFITDNKVVGTQIGGMDDFVDTYAAYGGSSNKHYRKADEALFISSDVALHLYHILIDRSFQKIEEEKFQPLLLKMTEALFLDSLTNYNKAENAALKESYKRLAVYYLIPLVILDSAIESEKLNPADFATYAQYLAAEEEQSKKASQAKLNFSLTEKKYRDTVLSDEIFELAQAEIELISEASEVTVSPLFTPYRKYFQNDYTQFKPRAHYTKNNYLKSYFISMMWYGRMGFSLDSVELTRDALVITGQVNSLRADDEKISDIYNTLSTAIEFFVGEVDDLTPYEFSELISEQYGKSLNVADFADESKLQDFIQIAIQNLPQPRIVSESVDLYDDGGERDELLKQLMQFRFMGQRFTPDAYVINNLTQGVGAPDPETGQNLPSMTTALMPIYVMSAGNKTVKEYIDKWVVKNAPDSDKIIDKKLAELSTEFAGYSADIWTQNIYWNWLNTYRSLLQDYNEGYPSFMTSSAWQKKNLGTVLGSYTELKHDTLLYAKQSYAELGAGGDYPDEIPPVPKGYVEADYAFWSNISELTRITVEDLEEQGLMPEVFKYRFNTFLEYSQFFRDIVEKELANEIISEDDFEKLRVSGYYFRGLVDALPGEELTTKERRAGIIADIHTDAFQGEILYEATAKPFVIYVAVEDKNGTRLTRGLVYNHYEFTGPLAERYADEDWQEKVYEGVGLLPESDEWSREIKK